MTLFNENPVDEIAYQLGIEDWNVYSINGSKPANPYQFGTDQWFSWNKGWNSVDPESKKNLLLHASEYVQGNDEVKPSVKAITDFQITEVSLMHDGTYQPGVFIRDSKFPEMIQMINGNLIEAPSVLLKKEIAADLKKIKLKNE